MSGVYAWYFVETLPGVPVQDCVRAANGAMLLYGGISPRTFSAKSSTQTIQTRLRYHYRGTAEGSTLRLTLGCLLAQQLGLRLRRVGSGKRLTFGDGELRLSAWMSQYARVCWITSDQPERL